MNDIKNKTNQVVMILFASFFRNNNTNKRNPPIFVAFIF